MNKMIILDVMGEIKNTIKFISNFSLPKTHMSLGECWSIHLLVNQKLCLVLIYVRKCKYKY